MKSLFVCVSMVLCLMGRAALAEEPLSVPPQESQPTAPPPTQPLPPMPPVVGNPIPNPNPYPYPPVQYPIPSVYSQVALTGQIVAMNQNALLLKNVVGRFAGRASAVLVTVQICSPNSCLKLNFDPQQGDYVRVAGFQTGDYSVSATQVERAEGGATSGMFPLTGSVKEVLPPAGGWQQIVVSNNGTPFEVQVCAPYNNSPVCPQSSGDFRKLGANVRVLGQIQGNLKIWKVENIFVDMAMQLPKLTVSPTHDFAPTEIGKTSELSIIIRNDGTGPAYNVTPNTLGNGAITLSNVSCPRIDPGGTCRFYAFFTPRDVSDQKLDVSYGYQLPYTGYQLPPLPLPVLTTLRGKGTLPPPAKLVIARGTFHGNWNKPSEPLVLKPGQELIFENNDYVDHRLLMNGGPCAQQTTISIPRGTVSCKAGQATGYVRAAKDPIYGGSLYFVIK